MAKRRPTSIRRLPIFVGPELSDTKAVIWRLSAQTEPTYICESTSRSPIRQPRSQFFKMPAYLEELTIRLGTGLGEVPEATLGWATGDTALSSPSTFLISHLTVLQSAVSPSLSPSPHHLLRRATVPETWLLRRRSDPRRSQQIINN